MPGRREKLFDFDVQSDFDSPVTGKNFRLFSTRIVHGIVRKKKNKMSTKYFQTILDLYVPIDFTQITFFFFTQKIILFSNARVKKKKTSILKSKL